MWTAITREVSPAIARCELSFVPREPINVTRAVEQHRDYLHALELLGCRVVTLSAQPELPDSVFVEDVAVVVDELAVMTRPGAESRRAEVASVANALRKYRQLAFIEEPGTLDGGDVLRLGREFYVGESARSNAAGIAQLRELLAPHGYIVQSVVTRGCLHLKSAVTQVSDDAVLLQPEWVDRDPFAAYGIIEVDPAEPHAANVVRVDDGLLMPASFPRTLERLLAAGLHVVSVDVSELQKAEGAVTCCSLLLRDHK
jgi:dimethylargininase